MTDTARTVELIWSEMEALQAQDDFDVSKYEELESERTSLIARGETRKRHNVYAQVTAPGVITATPKGDAGEEFAWAQYLKTGQPNSDLTFAQTEGSASAGGYAVPDGFLSRVIEKRTAFGGLLNAAEQLTTASGNDLHYPVMPAAVYTASDIAAEGAATAVGADIVVAEVVLGAYRYVASGTGNVPLKVSYELLQDSIFDIGAFVAKHLGERIARKQAYDVCNGSGSGEPQGIAYGTAGTIEHDPDGWAAFNNVIHALDPVYRNNASWIFNDTTAAALENLLDGASGTSGRPMLMPAFAGLTGAFQGYTLGGYPVIIDQAMPTWAADNVIGAGFGDWSQAYIVRHVRDVVVLVNPYVAVGYVGYEAWARMDGRVQNSSAYVTGEGT